MRLIIVLLVVVGVCLWWGGQNTYIALRDRHQLEITCADYIKKRPDSRWLKLTHCEADFDNLAVETDSGGYKIRKVYLPLRPEGETSGPTRIVVVRDDEDIIAAVKAPEHHGVAAQHAIDNVLAQLQQPTEGLVQFGLDLDDKDKEQLAGLSLGLDKDFVLVDYQAKPKLQKGLFVLSLGLAGIAFLGFLILRRFRKHKTPPAPPRPADPNNPISAFERPI
jgi:hypothetical protein